MAMAIKLVKWAAVGLAAVILALVLLMLLIDWNWVKGYAERAISEQTGRQFAIAGDLDVDLSLKPRIRATKVQFENAPWSKDPQMVKVGLFDIRLDLLQLMQGRIVIPELRIVEPIIRLEKSAQGKPNWELRSEPVAEKAVETAAPEERSEFPVVSRLIVEGGWVKYVDHATSTDVTLGITSIHGSTRGKGGQVTLDGDGQLEAQPWRMALRAGSFEKLQSANIPYPVDLRLKVGDTRASIEGVLRKPIQMQGVNLSASLEGPDLSVLAPFFPGAAPKLPAYSIEGHVVRADEDWHLQNFQARVGKSNLKGEVTIATGGKRPLVKADLTSNLVHYDDFVRLVPPSKEQRQSKPLDLSPLKSMDAVVNVRGDEILTPALTLRDLQVTIELKEGRLRVDPVSLDVGGGRMQVQAVLDARSQPFEAFLQSNINQVDLGKLRDLVTAKRRLDGILDGHVKVSVTGASATQMKEGAGAGALSVINSLVVEDSRFSYDALGSGTRLDIVADSATMNGRRTLQIRGDGRWRGEPFELALRIDPLLELADVRTNKPYAVKLRASGLGTQVRVNGALRQPLASRDLDLALSVSGSGTDQLSAALGKPLPNISPYHIEGRVRREAAKWEVDGFQGRVGESDLRGDIEVNTEGERPFVRAALVSRRLKYNDFMTFLEKSDRAKAKQQEANAQQAGKSADAPFDLTALQQLNAEISFEGKEIIAQKLPLGHVGFDIALHGGHLTVDPFTLGLGGGTVEGMLSLDSSAPMRGTLTTRIQHVDIQEIVEPFDLEATFGILSGHAKISIVGANKQQIAAAAEQTPLTFIHSLMIEDTRFSYRDLDSDTDIQAKIATTTTSNGNEPINVHGRGRYQGEPFSLDANAGSLLRLLEEKQPYPIQVEAKVANTQASLEGDITQPLNLKGMDINISVKGPNPNQLNKLAGVPLPDLPPYRIEGQVSRQGDVWRLLDLDGGVGDSDMAGHIEITTLREPRPMIVADLVSRRLDLDDFAGLIGAAPDTGPGETESGQQQREAKAEDKSVRVLPKEPFHLESLRDLDARLNFKGKRIETILPIDDLRLQATLRNGRLNLKPLNLGIGGGDIRSRVVLDASARPVQAEIETQVSHLNLKRVLRRFEFAEKSVGNIGGRANLKATGDSVAELMATLDGRLSLIMAGGRIDSLLLELAGIDALQAIGDLLGDEEAVPIRCAFTDLKAKEGQVDVKSFVIDTTDTKFIGDGTINLDEERVRLVIAPQPKDFSLFAVGTPIRIGGRFGDLAFYPESELAERVAASVVLGLVATPFAALIPLIETGTGKNAACQSLLNESNDGQRTAESHPGRKDEAKPEARAQQAEPETEEDSPSRSFLDPQDLRP